MNPIWILVVLAALLKIPQTQGFQWDGSERVEKEIPAISSLSFRTPSINYILGGRVRKG